MKFAYHSVILSNAKDDTTFTDIEGTCSILHLISLIINKYLAYSLSVYNDLSSMTGKTGNINC